MQQDCLFTVCTMYITEITTYLQFLNFLWTVQKSGVLLHIYWGWMRANLIILVKQAFKNNRESQRF